MNWNDLTTSTLVKNIIETGKLPTIDVVVTMETNTIIHIGMMLFLVALCVILASHMADSISPKKNKIA